MGRNKSQERLKLEAIMEEDDRWWDRDELFAKWYPTVPPSIAMRAAEKAYSRGGMNANRIKDTSQHQLQRIGAKHIFNQTLGAMRQRNKIEERRRSGTVEIRLVPEDVSNRFERYFAVAVVGSEEEGQFDIYDPHSKVLVLSLKICSQMSDEDLKALMRWAQLREDESSVFLSAFLIARKVLNDRNKDKFVVEARAAE